MYIFLFFGSINLIQKYMKKNIIQEEIIELLEVLVEQTDIISNYKEQVPQIEIDIVLTNIRELYEKFRVFEKLNKTSQEVVSRSQEKNNNSEKEDIIEAPELSESKNSEMLFEVPESKAIETMPVEQVVYTENIVEETAPVEETKQIILPVAEEKEAETVIEIKEKTVTEINTTSKKEKHSKKTHIDLFSSAPTIADKFKEEKISLNELLNSESHTEKSIAGKMQKKPISDLKLAIGINEKFKLINELFEGNLQKYNESITNLNCFESFEEANLFLTSLKKEFNWTESNETFSTLVELVTRRYL